MGGRRYDRIEPSNTERVFPKLFDTRDWTTPNANGVVAEVKSKHRQN